MVTIQRMASPYLHACEYHLMACSEAERLAQAEEAERHNDTLAGVDIGVDPVLKSVFSKPAQSESHDAPSQVDERAIIIINAQSVIQLTNDAVTGLLGYAKSELKGRNLRVILPPSAAESHGTFVRNYIATGRSVVLNTTTSQVSVVLWISCVLRQLPAMFKAKAPRSTFQVVMHKDKRLLPIRLTVRKISGIGEDTLILGVLQASPRQDGCITRARKARQSKARISKHCTRQRQAA
jgi:PAS domain-containing protein